MDFMGFFISEGFWGPKNGQNFNFILEQSLLNKKVVFLHKNNSFLGFGPQKLILGGVLGLKPHFWGIFDRLTSRPKLPMTDLNTLAGSKRSLNERNDQTQKAWKFRKASINRLGAMGKKP